MDTERANQAPGPKTLVDRSAAFVLEQMLVGNDVRARRLALARVDPLVRRRVEQRVRSLLADAEFESRSSSGSHHICLALLELAGVQVDAPTDEQAVTERAAALPKPSRAPRWTRTLAVLVGVVLVAVAVVVVRALAPEPYEALTLVKEESRAAYRGGGRPAHDPAIDEVLARFVTALTMSAEHVNEGGSADADFERARAELGDAEFVRAFGAQPVEALRRLADAHEAFVRGTGEPDAVRRAARRVDDVCVRQGLGYRVEVYPISGGRLAIVANSVEAVSLVRMGGSTQRVLLVRRVDHLNVLYPALGYIDAGTAVIPVDAVERFALGTLLPLLDEPPRLTLMDSAVSLGRYPWLVETHASAAVAFRHALAEARCPEADVDELHALLLARRAIFEQWASHVTQFGLTFEPPDDYRVDVDALRDAAGSRFPRFGEFARLQDQLSEEGPSRTFGCVRGVVAAELAVQAADLASSPTPPTDEPRPPSLVALLDPAQTMSAEQFRESSSVARVRSAFARIANAPSLGVTLVFMLRCYTHGGTCRRESEMATVFTFTELARELRLTSFVEPSRAAASTVAAIFRELVAKPEAEVRRAAGTAFQRLFGRPSPTLVHR